MNTIQEKQIREFRRKYEGANTPGTISTLMMDEMVKDILNMLQQIEEEAKKEGIKEERKMIAKGLTVLLEKHPQLATEAKSILYDVLSHPSL